jgi:hypothetical protein
MGVYDYSTYPRAVDGYSQIRIVVDGVSEVVGRDHNSLRSAVVNIEQTLGTMPQASYTTVRARLDVVEGAKAVIDAHLIDPTDAHPASAISILDSVDAFTSSDVEGALSELSSVLPQIPNVIGEPATTLPNTGVPDFVTGGSTKSLFNTSGGANILVKTQPVGITGIHVLDVSDDCNGPADLKLSNHSPATLQWKCNTDPGFGAGVDISTLAEGEISTIASSATSKRIRIMRTADALPVSSPITETFDVISLSAETGAFSVTGEGIIDTNFVTRAAQGINDITRAQFVVSGIACPADKGTLVLQRKLYLTDASPLTQFEPIAVLQLDNSVTALPKAGFDEGLRLAGQPPYAPSFTAFDTVTLYDRLPMSPDYDTMGQDANGDQLYTNYDVSHAFPPFQLAKYKIPASNPSVTTGTLAAATGLDALSAGDLVGASAYRVVHFKPGVSSFSGDPAADDIFSVRDALGGGVDAGDNNVRMSLVFVDSDQDRPVIASTTFAPANSVEAVVKQVSGIHYYNSPADLFNLTATTSNLIFTKSYLRDGILTIDSDALTLPSGSGYGNSVSVTELYDSTNTKYSDVNLPDFTDLTKDTAYYKLTGAFNPTRRPYPAQNVFSSDAFVTITARDPFGAENATEAHGDTFKIQVNSHYDHTANDREEFFVDESFRNGTSEDYALNTAPTQFNHNYGPNADGFVLDVWDGTLPLSFGELQVGGLTAHDTTTPGLVFPQFDYTTDVRPTQDGSTDYSAAGYVVDSIYQRLFSTDHVISAGKLVIRSGGTYPLTYNDLDASNSTRPVKIEVKIPGNDQSSSTGWLDLGAQYRFGHYENGYGCRTYVEESGNEITVHFTLGQRSTATSGTLLAVRVTYFGAQFLGAKNRIITYLGLQPE